MSEKEKEIIQAAYQCADALGCKNCPLEPRKVRCAFTFANFIKIADIEGRFKDTEKEPASSATDTDSDLNKPESGLQDNNTTIRKKSQVLLNTIISFADDIISDDNADNEIAGYAGAIKGLTYSLKELGGDNNG